MSGHLKKSEPVNLQLYDVDLPWVKTATHLGHELSWDCTMNDDMRQKRATFIGRSTEVRETFGFAQPNQIIQAVQTYCFDMYGAMTWPLYSQRAKQVFNTWSTCVKLAWGVPRATHTYLVDNFLSGGIPSIRASVLARYSKFVNRVRSSQSCGQYSLSRHQKHHWQQLVLLGAGGRHEVDHGHHVGDEESPAQH